MKISIDKNKVSLYVEDDDVLPFLEHEFDCFLNNGEIGLTARKSKTQFDDFKFDLEIDML